MEILKYKYLVTFYHYIYCEPSSPIHQSVSKTPTKTCEEISVEQAREQIMSRSRNLLEGFHNIVK